MRRLSALLPRSIRWFVVVGTINTAIYYVGYLLLHGAGVQYLVAHLCATAFAMVCSYFLNCWLTFRITPSWRTFVLFPLSNLANVVITTAGMRLVVGYTSIDQRIAPLPVAAIAIPITYVLTRYLLVGRDRFAAEAEREAHDAGHLTRLDEMRRDPSTQSH